MHRDLNNFAYTDAALRETCGWIVDGALSIAKVEPGPDSATKLVTLSDGRATPVTAAQLEKLRAAEAEAPLAAARKAQQAEILSRGSEAERQKTRDKVYALAVGQAIRSLLRPTACKPETLAELLGVSPAAMNVALNGSISSPDFSAQTQVRALHQALVLVTAWSQGAGAPIHNVEDARAILERGIAA